MTTKEKAGQHGARVTPAAKAARDLYLTRQGVDPGGTFTRESDDTWNAIAAFFADEASHVVSATQALVDHIGPDCADERLFNLRVNADIAIRGFRGAK